MHPELFTIRGFTIYTYGPIMAFGFLLAFLLVYHLAQKRGEDLDFYLDLYVWIIVFGLLGAKLLYNFLEYREFLAHPLRMMNCRNGGLVWYGGVILDMAFIFWYSRRRGIPTLQVMDTLAAPMALGLGIGRWGCLMGGCCYGRATNVPWAIVYPPGANDVAGIPVHPAPIYASLASLLIALTIYLVIRRTARRGLPSALWLTLYPLARFIIEFFRGDEARGFFYRGPDFTLSTSQFIGLLALLGAAGLWVWIARHPVSEIVRPEPPPEAAKAREPRPPKKKPGKKKAQSAG